MKKTSCNMVTEIVQNSIKIFSFDNIFLFDNIHFHSINFFYLIKK